MLGGWELIHVAPNFREQAAGCDPVHTGYRHQPLDLFVPGLAALLDLLREFGDLVVEKMHLIQQFLHLKTVPLLKTALEGQTEFWNFASQLGLSHFRKFVRIGPKRDSQRKPA